jgi:uncharacterized protein YegL
MTKPNLTEIIIVLDRSGSMDGIVDDTIGGINTLITEQAKNPGEVKLTLIQFDNQYEVFVAGRPIKDVPLLNKATYVPRGSTALLDAIGRTINDVGARLSTTKEEERPSLVLFVIQTDGQENASREYTHEKIKQMIAHQKDTYKWQFLFLGADQDAFQGMGLGLAQGTVYNYFTPDSFKMYRNLSSSIVQCSASADPLAQCANIADVMRSNDQNPITGSVDAIIKRQGTADGK